MLAVERRNDILARLMADGKVIVSDLSKRYDVTEETIRRDLEKLENDGFAKKTYGGAVRNESFNVDVPYNVRKRTNVTGKQYIAGLVGDMIDDSDYIILDASTTALFIAKNIIRKNRITLITNSVEILLELSNKTDWNIMCTGGELKKSGLSLVGYQAEKMVSNFHTDIAVFSCKGLDIGHGITDPNERDAQVKKAFLKAAKRKILVADYTKFDKVSFANICDMQDIDTVVTDVEPSDEWKKYFSDAGVELIF